MTDETRNLIIEWAPVVVLSAMMIGAAGLLVLLVTSVYGAGIEWGAAESIDSEPVAALRSGHQPLPCAPSARILAPHTVGPGGTLSVAWALANNPSGAWWTLTAETEGHTSEVSRGSAGPGLALSQIIGDVPSDAQPSAYCLRVRSYRGTMTPVAQASAIVSIVGVTRTPTRTPVATATPTRTPSDGCESGSVVLRFSGIPEMTDSTKDQINKQCLGGLSGPGQLAVLVHRYYQPGWSEECLSDCGPWWPVWRLECPTSINPDQWVGSWGLCGDLHSPFASFRFDWTARVMTVTCIETGESETVTRPDGEPDYRLSAVCSGDSCRIPGVYEPRDSVATVTADGPVCGTAPGGDWTQRLQVSGISGQLPDSCALFCYQAPDGGVWARVRRETGWADGWQIKGRNGDVWVEVPTYGTTGRPTDGVWIVALAGYDLSITSPLGDTRTATLDYRPQPSDLRTDPPWGVYSGGDCPGVTVEVEK